MGTEAGQAVGAWRVVVSNLEFLVRQRVLEPVHQLPCHVFGHVARVAPEARLHSLGRAFRVLCEHVVHFVHDVFRRLRAARFGRVQGLVLLLDLRKAEELPDAVGRVVVGEMPDFNDLAQAPLAPAQHHLVEVLAAFAILRQGRQQWLCSFVCRRFHAALDIDPGEEGLESLRRALCGLCMRIAGPGDHCFSEAGGLVGGKLVAPVHRHRCRFLAV